MTACGGAAAGGAARRAGLVPGVAVAVALAAALIAGCAGLGADGFCTASATGRTAAAAARSFVAACGGDYRITRGPYGVDAQTSGYASYAQVTELTIAVADNSEGSLGFLLVGRRARHGPWRTLGPLGSGP